MLNRTSRQDWGKESREEASDGSKENRINAGHGRYYYYSCYCYYTT